MTPPSVRAAVLALPLLAITAVARPAAAQTTRAGDGCTFERCGLRVQGSSVYRGLEGERVGRMGLFYADLRFLQAAPDSAGILARRAVSRHERSGLLRHLAQFSFMPTYAMSLARIGDDDVPAHGWTALGLAVAGLLLDHIADRRGEGAATAMSRSVWWYNHDVAAGRIGDARPDLPPLDPDHFGRAGLGWGYAIGITAGTILASESDQDEPVVELIAVPAASAVVGWLVGRVIPRR